MEAESHVDQPSNLKFIGVFNTSRNISILCLPLLQLRIST